jgi:hypothetical protein
MTSQGQKRQPTCRNWQILLGEYVLGTIAERDRARLEKHVAGCRRCRRALAETEKIYRLLDDVELAPAGPFFAAKVARAWKEEAGVAEAAADGAKARTPFWNRLRAPAFISAAAAAAAALLAVTLYVKVWRPDGAEPPGVPTARTGEPPAAGLAEAYRLAEAGEKEPGGAEAREAETPELTEAEGTLAEAEAPEAFTTYDAALGAAPSEAGAGATAALEDKLVAPEEPAATFDEFAAGMAGAALSRGDRSYGRAEKKAAAPDATAAPALAAANVEAWMDARLKVDVERLTGEEAALLDYVTPDGVLMAYFYELPLEEQRVLLGRLRREAEETPTTEMLFFH